MLPPEITEALAVCVLVVLSLAPLACAVLDNRKYGYTPTLYFFYFTNKLLTRVLWRTEISRLLPIADDEGCVIVCNHRAGIDPFFIALTTRRLVHWMVAEEYCKNPAFGWALRGLQVIPTRRSGIDTAATKAAIRYAQGGQPVGMFPEGRINMTDRLLLPGRPGAALVALKARVRVVPCYIHGSPYAGTAVSSFFMTAKVRLQVGDPIDLSPWYGQEHDRQILSELTRKFLGEIAALAGCPDYEPELAGRRWKTDDAA